MLTLEQYLADEFRHDQQEIATLDRYLKIAATTFSQTFTGKQWPYEFKTTDPQFKQAGFSQGTVAMATTSTGRLLGCCSGGLERPFKRKKLQDYWSIALESLIKDLEDKAREKKYGARVRSSTFGNNNALTLSHLSELASSLPEKNSSERTRMMAALDNAHCSVLKDLDNEIPGPLLTTPKARYQTNAFIPVRAIRACRDFKKDASFSKLERFFESGLHTQLSYSLIPDSRFDPSEMLFCLEGLLLCDRKAVESAALDRLLGVLAEKQDTSAYWRPNKPFLASSTGEIVLPLSVEGANSLMRSVCIMDEGRTHDLFCSKSVPLLRRFWEWLLARALHFQIEGEECIGWHSEHVNEPDLVHIWDTCQVVEFMIAYRRLLAGHVAHRTLLLSNVKARQPVPLKDTLKLENATWSDVVADREPLMNTVPSDQAYLQVGNKFIDPRSEGKKKLPYSMLLYGPPGTGKSSLAELMADALEWPLITITVSDFLGSGGAMVEARAKAIFQMLESQEHAVILFDEIDSFLLDRDSKFYRDQETLFQFITPGMLTKINDLRKAQRSIFIIATNYANRIDPAIKRVGRIDDRILLLPPNLARRKAMIEKAWQARNKDLPKNKRKAPPDCADEMAKAFCYLGWNDIDDVVDEIFDSPVSPKTLIERIEAIDRSTGPKFYGRRFPREGPFEDEIRKEVQWLAKLADESDNLQFANDFVGAAAQAAAAEAPPELAGITKAAKAFVDNLGPGGSL